MESKFSWPICAINFSFSCLCSCSCNEDTWWEGVGALSLLCFATVLVLGRFSWTLFGVLNIYTYIGVPIFWKLARRTLMAINQAEKLTSKLSYIRLMGVHFHDIHIYFDKLKGLSRYWCNFKRYTRGKQKCWKR